MDLCKQIGLQGILFYTNIKSTRDRYRYTARNSCGLGSHGFFPKHHRGLDFSKLNFLKPSTIFHVPKLGYAWSVLEGQELLAVREQGFLAWVKLVVPNQSIGKSV